MRNKKDSFWLSYSDLMTSLFFIMLVLFIVSIVKMKGINAELNRTANATKKQLEKITTKIPHKVQICLLLCKLRIHKYLSIQESLLQF